MATDAVIKFPEFKGDNLSVKMFGAIPDLIFGSDGIASAGNVSFTTSTTNFTPSCIGKTIWIENLGGGADHLTTIAGFVGPHSIALTAAPPFAASPTAFRYGTDNLEAIQAAFDFGTDRGARLLFPRGAYGIVGSLVPHDNLAVMGLSYTHNPFRPYEPDATAQLVGLSDVPIINYTGSQLFSLHIEKMTLRGTSRTGSKGLYISNLFGICLRDFSVNYFGDQGIQIDAGVDGTFENCFGGYTLLVRSRAGFAGGFQIGCSDFKMNACMSTTHVTFPSGAIIGGEYGDGHGAGIMVTGGNSFASNSFAHGSQIGWYITNSGSLTTFVNCRADLNQGQGFIVDSSNCQLIGCRSNANSIDSDGTYNAFEALRGGNRFMNCQVTYNGVGPDPINNRVNNCFLVNAPGGSEDNYFSMNYCAPGSFVGQQYSFTGGTLFNPTVDLDTTGPGSLLKLFKTDLLLTDPTAAADKKNWVMRLNRSGTHQLYLSTYKDDFTGEVVYAIIDRDTGFILLQSAGFLQIDMPTLIKERLKLYDNSQAANERKWMMRFNASAPELLFSTLNDAESTENQFMKVGRSGATISYINLLAGYIQTFCDLRIGDNAGTSYHITFTSNGMDISAGAGNPSITASAGSLYLDSNGLAWVHGASTWEFLLKGASTGLATHGVLFGNGTGAISSSSAGSVGQVLRSGGAGADGAYDSAGVTHSSSFTTGATTSTSTIQYKDWASANQSITVVVSVSTNQETAGFTNGLRTT